MVVGGLFGELLGGKQGFVVAFELAAVVVVPRFAVVVLLAAFGVPLVVPAVACVLLVADPGTLLAAFVEALAPGVVLTAGHGAIVFGLPFVVEVVPLVVVADAGTFELGFVVDVADAGVFPVEFVVPLWPVAEAAPAGVEFCLGVMPGEGCIPGLGWIPGEGVIPGWLFVVLDGVVVCVAVDPVVGAAVVPGVVCAAAKPKARARAGSVSHVFVMSSS